MKETWKEAKKIMNTKEKNKQPDMLIENNIEITNDEEIAEIAKSYSAEVPFLRPKEIATDESPGIAPVIHALENIANVDNLLLLQPTSPFRETKHIEEIFKLRSKLNSESAVSISSSKKNIDLLLFYLCDMQCCMATVKDNLTKTASQVKDIVSLANKLNIEVVFGGSGIQFLSGVSSKIQNTFNKYSDLEKII